MTTNKSTTTVEALMAGINAGAYKLIQAYAEKSDNPRVEYSKNGKQLFHYSGEMLHVYEDVTFEHNVKVVFGLGDSNPDPEPSEFSVSDVLNKINVCPGSELNILGQTQSFLTIDDVMDQSVEEEYWTEDGYKNMLTNKMFDGVPYHIHKEIMQALKEDHPQWLNDMSITTKAVLDDKFVSFLSIWDEDSEEYFTYQFKKA